MVIDTEKTSDEDLGKRTSAERPITVTAGDASDGPSNEEPVPHLHSKTFLAILAVCLIYVAQLINLVAAGAQGQTIAGHFNDTPRVTWFTTSIAIFTVVLGPPVAQAADYWGRKHFLVILTLFGAAGSLVIARATSMNMAIAGFCIVGISYGNQPLLHVVTSEVLPRRWRGWAQAADMTSNAVGTLIGLYVGGALNRTNDPASDGFRYYYYMTMGFFLLASILCFLVYNPPPLPTQRGLTNYEKLAKLDWIGYFLLASGLVLFSVGLSYSKNPYQWTDARVSATFTVGITLSLCLVIYETSFKKDGMFHHGLFTTNRNFAISIACVFSEGVAFFAANTYFAFEISVLFETDALLVGVRYSTMMIVSALSACATGYYCARTRSARWATFVAFLIFVIFFVCMATVRKDNGGPTWGFPVIIGIALGMTLTTLMTVAQLSTPPELLSIASGLFISVRSLGGTIGLAIYNAMFNEAMGHLGENVAGVVLPGGLVKEEDLGRFIGALVAHNVTALGDIEGVDEKVIGLGADAVLDTFVAAFRQVWIAGACFVALAAGVSLFLFDPHKEFNMHIDAPVEKEEDLYLV
ncbi:major facilitator superfamily domain-containing protein [Rhypophila decipiens]|uniref:Major facilitator superfamily domain-containing protein n=1 Tax=Rhypophila decipiens TaxID=261697 RepID=A0AAN6Y6R6_9PEZI|nr:major facilitator superfamily domain-containing protein [Rhypophila decipiens]